MSLSRLDEDEIAARYYQQMSTLDEVQKTVTSLRKQVTEMRNQIVGLEADVRQAERERDAYRDMFKGLAEKADD